MFELFLRHSFSCTGGAACCRHDLGLPVTCLYCCEIYRVGPNAYSCWNRDGKQQEWSAITNSI